MTLRVSEVYPSVQGEGPRTGQTTIFVRFGGCNLRCPGWPCDTQHAIDPKYRMEWVKWEPDDLFVHVTKEALRVGAKLITLTGGEPFLQKNEDLHMFVDGLLMQGFEVEAFTNGTLVYPAWAVAGVSMIMDWKLPGSGEDPLNENRIANIMRLKEAPREHAAKFVIKDTHDFIVAASLWSSHLKGSAIIPYYGKVWDGNITDAQLAELVMGEQLPWRMNVQLHNYIWDPQERGR